MKNSDYVYGLTRLWWLPLLTGLLFIGFGVWCLCAPAESLPILAYIFAGILGAVGIFNLFFGFINSGSYHGWGWTAATGVVEILFSIFLFFLPSNILTIAFTYGVGIYIIFMTIYYFFESFMMSRQTSPLWLCFLILFVLAALVFACIFILGPIGGMVMGWLYIGISFICYGIFRIMLACEIKKLG